MKLIKMIGNFFFFVLILATVVVYAHGIITVKDFFWFPGLVFIVSISISWYFFRKKFFKGDEKNESNN
ncbi:MAG: hypothetical protein ACOX1S_10160 [Anaerostipes sp.]|jgi:4-amino-4-deoxy-L-arabinose transferase-like glycosyltransferase|nr:hypothetical protein [Anaerostipes sp.]